VVELEDVALRVYRRISIAGMCKMRHGLSFFYHTIPEMANVGKSQATITD